MAQPQLLVLYVPTLDRRWLSPDVTPNVCRWLERNQVIPLETHPSVELLPSMVTGVWPEKHRLWQVRLLPEKPRTVLQGLIDLFPDRVTTTWQCVRHRFDKDFDLPTVEPRRRRRFEMHRIKMQRRHGGGLDGVDYGGVPSVFSVLQGDCRHRTIFSFDEAADGLDAFVDGSCQLDLLEFYAFDVFCHWNLDQPDAVRKKLRRTDMLLNQAYEKALQLGILPMLVVDHGQEPVRHAIDLPRLLAASGVPQDEYSYYIEVCNARFWFFTDRAREVLCRRLAEIERATLLDNKQMERFHVHFRAEDGFGDVYLISDQGTMFFPHDFYHPLVNWYMARLTPEQASRKRSPLHRGTHGHLPGHPADSGYIVGLVPELRPLVTHGELIDVASTLLTVLGRKVPAGMMGRPLFEMGGGSGTVTRG